MTRSSQSTPRQWGYYRMWFILVGAAELLMLVFNQNLVLIYRGIAVLFFGGFLLRALRLYPGEAEPLMLDASGALLAMGFAFTAGWLGDSWLRFLVIFCSSVIIIPHFIFIAKEK